jgi:hypothetical protein
LKGNVVLKVIKECVGWLDWKFVAVGVALLVALAVCAKLPTIGILAGAAPLLLLVVCLIPCLVPLAWLRKATGGEARQAPASESVTDTHS